MTDEPELELLRRSDPVPAGDPRWRDRPLDARTELGLRRLLAAETASEAASEAAAASAPRRTARRLGGLVTGLAAVAAAVVAVLVLVLSGAGTTPAVAAPVALRPLAGSPEVPLADVAGAAREAAAQGGGTGTRRGSHVMMWSMGMESGPGARPPVTLPEEHLTRWNADGSGTELVVATDPRHPGEPVISDSGGAPRTVADGEVLHRAAYPPGTLPRTAGPGPSPRTPRSNCGRTCPRCTAAPAPAPRNWWTRWPRCCRTGRRGPPAPPRSTSSSPPPPACGLPVPSPTGWAGAARPTSTTPPGCAACSSSTRPTGASWASRRRTRRTGPNTG